MCLAGWRACAWSELTLPDDACMRLVPRQADVLLHGLDMVQITHLQMMDNKIGGPGCLALGEALMLGGNTSLMTLRLGHNTTMGTEGVTQLCKGLRTNHKLSVRDICVVVARHDDSLFAFVSSFFVGVHLLALLASCRCGMDLSSPSRCTCPFATSTTTAGSRWRNCWRSQRRLSQHWIWKGTT